MHESGNDAGPATLVAQARALIGEERDPIANAANLSALLFMSLDDLNWAGFYFLRGDTLVVGPFQGQPACVRIPLGRGVCGTAAASGVTQVVDDVHQFEGHIACDAASRSEIVVPLVRDGKVYGVLDVDSPSLARFKAPERDLIEALAGVYTQLSARLR
jgi:GAF domain-containing protein